MNCPTIRADCIQKKVKYKTYNSRYSLVVTHLTTNLPVRCLNRAERTGSLVFNVLWSYVKCRTYIMFDIAMKTNHLRSTRRMNFSSPYQLKPEGKTARVGRTV